jgi:lipoic acid synthetase
LRRRIPLLSECTHIESTVKKHRLHTICREALCPNRAECYSRGKATFIILGDVCTRGCGFCSVNKGVPGPPDPLEPDRVAAAAAELGLRYVIVTSVTRDDLPDGGSAHYAAVIEALRLLDPKPVIEVLVPDFRGSIEALQTVLEAGPDVLAHNMETVRRLYRAMRRGADYERSLRMLDMTKQLSKEVMTKTSFILGMGETADEVIDAFVDVREAGCDVLALGQYLRPGLDQVPVCEYVPPERFSWLADRARKLGFAEVSAGPLVRSSYHEIDVPVTEA